MALTSGVISESDETRKLVSVNSDGTTSAITTYADTTYTDHDPTGGNVNIAFSFQTNLFDIPRGNHIHELRQPDQTSPFEKFLLEWISAGNDPAVLFAVDDSGTPAIAVEATTEPAIRAASIGYKTKAFWVNRMAQRIALKISRTADSSDFILETIAFVWQLKVGT